MAALVRGKDWSATPLGPTDAWPASLRTLVDTILAQPLPMIVLWGPQLIQIYNDGYRLIAADKHPAALGQSTYECWPEAQYLTRPVYQRVFAGESVYLRDQSLALRRRGILEEGFFTLAFSPVRDDAGRVAGVLCVVFDTTGETLVERERRVVARQVEAERARLVEAFAQAPSFMAVLRGPEHAFEFVNERYNRLLGGRPLVGRTVRDAIPEVERQGYFEILDRVYATGEAFVGRDMRLALRREPDGPLDEVYVDFVYQPMRGPDGAVAGILAHGIDVTARRQAEVRDRFLLALDDAVRPLTDPVQITATYARLLGEHLGADRCAYADVEADQDTFNLTGDYNRPGVPSIVGRYRFADFGGEVLRLMRQGRPFVVHDVDAHHPPVGDFAAYRKTMIRAVVCVPLHKGGRFVAAMAVHQRVPRRWAPEEVELVRHVAARCWESIERARVARDLRASEERYRAIFERAAVGMAEVSLDGRFLTVNRAYCQITGHPLENLIGRPTSSITHPDDVAGDDETRAQAVTDGSMMQRREARYVRPDGSIVWVSLAANVVSDATGRLTHLIAAVADVTARRNAEEALRESEERFRAAFDQSMIGKVLSDLEGRVLRANDAFCRIVGRDRAELVGRDSRGYTHPDDVARNVEVLERVRSGAAANASFEKRYVRPDGAVIDAQVNVSAVRAGGRVVNLIVVVDDITARRRAAAEREELLARERAARAEAEAASRAKDEFLAVLSHELRTPLTPVLLTASLLESHPGLPPELREEVASIRRNVELESRLISDLLDLTRIARGKLQLQVQRVDLHRVLRSAVDICQREASARLTLDLSAARHAVRGDGTRLQQIFWNLVNNAQKFTGPGGSITVRSYDAPDGRVRVEVRDTGVGIDPAVLPRLFNAFEQGDARAQRQQAGLGLGLAISRKLAEAHGGTITAHSAGRGTGATFTVELPAVGAAADDGDSDEPAAAGSRTPSRPPALTLRAGRPLSVLLVEDHEPTLGVLVKLLGKLGHRVTGVSSVASATAAARGDAYDLIVSDLGLPDGSGLDLMRQLRDQYAGRVIALTGYGMESDVKASREAGFAEHLTKPVELHDLDAAIRRVAAAAGEAR